MSIFEIISVTISAFAFVFTIIIWRGSLSSLKESIRQNENSIRVFQSDAMNNITSAHRDLYLNILKDDKLTEIIANSAPVDDFRKKMIGTILINHCNAIFLYAQKSLIEADDWIGLQNDIKDFFTWNAVATRWPNIRGFYSQDFQNFIDTLTVKGRLDVALKSKL